MSKPRSFFRSVPVVLACCALFGCAAAIFAQAPDFKRFTFDPAQVEVRFRNEHWLVLSGERELKDFGRQEREAHEAVRLIRELNLSSHVAIGKTKPIVEYWLANSQAPDLAAARMPAIAIDGATLRVEQVLSHWCLRDAHRVLFAFGLERDSAEEALGAIRRHDFTHVAFLGRPQSIMMIFFTSRHQPTTTAVEKPAYDVSTLPVVLKETDPASRKTTRPLQSLAKDQKLSSADLDLIAFRNAQQLASAPNEAKTIANGRLRFDWRQAQLRYVPPAWRLVVGETVLADFGPNEQAARAALRIFEYYQFTERQTLGTANSPFSYYLVRGQAPRGVALGVQSAEFRPDYVDVRRLPKGWALCYGERELLNFGENQDEAQQVLKLVEKHWFDHLCWVGDRELSAKGLVFFARER